MPGYPKQASVEPHSLLRERAAEGNVHQDDDGPGDAHDVLKMEDATTLDLYVYQDRGQTTWHREETYRSTYVQCLNFSFGEVCGTVKETVTPSGEYKSSFKSD